VDEEALNKLTKRIIGCAIEVHRHLGPGLLESIYESAMCIELELAGLAYERQKPIPVTYKGHILGEHRLDILVEDTVILELKSVERFDPVFEAQILSYLQMTGKPIGLLINFNTRLVKDGIRRYRL
jgi:GxxExxY protein